jgi:hypothetical protein
MDRSWQQYELIAGAAGTILTQEDLAMPLHSDTVVISVDFPTTITGTRDRLRIDMFSHPYGESTDIGRPKVSDKHHADAVAFRMSPRYLRGTTRTGRIPFVSGKTGMQHQQIWDSQFNHESDAPSTIRYPQTHSFTGNLFNTREDGYSQANVMHLARGVTSFAEARRVIELSYDAYGIVDLSPAAAEHATELTMAHLRLIAPRSWAPETQPDSSQPESRLARLYSVATNAAAATLRKYGPRSGSE